MRQSWKRFGSGTGKVAADRLRQMKIAEQTDCSAEDLELMKEEIHSVISKYIAVGSRDIRLFLRRGKKTNLLLTAILLPHSEVSDQEGVVRKN